MTVATARLIRVVALSMLASAVAVAVTSIAPGSGAACSCAPIPDAAAFESADVVSTGSTSVIETVGRAVPVVGDDEGDGGVIGDPSGSLVEDAAEESDGVALVSWLSAALAVVVVVAALRTGRRDDPTST